MKKLLILLIILFSYSFSWSATYYVDFNSGSDSANGTSTSTPWLNLPGTCTLASSGSIPCTYLTNTWASISAGDTINIKSGTTHDSTKGGAIQFSYTHYATNATAENPIIIQRDTTWGSGAVTIDGNSIPSAGGRSGLVHIRHVSGLKFDGKTTDGLVIQNAAWDGICACDSNNTLVAPSVRYAKFYNNGTAVNDTGSGASEGSINYFSTTGGIIQYVNVDGNNTHINGIQLGEDYYSAIGYLIDNVKVYNHTCGDANAGDWGMGIKSTSGDGTVSNSELYNNFKGSDNGTKGVDAVALTRKFINVHAHDNVEAGINGNGGNAVNRYKTSSFYLINSIIRDNGRYGSNFYGGNMALYFVHNVYDNNGGTKDDVPDGNLIISNNNSPYETGTINSYLYNNIFYKPAGYQNISQHTFIMANPANFSLYSDYNAWVQNSSENFADIGYYSPSDVSCTFIYGANGPGKASGNWYSWYECSVTQPSNGALGHYHQDAHSKCVAGITNCNDTAPLFTNVAGHDYTLTSAYAGTNLSTQPWYISEMGTDRNGVSRSSWDIGAYEYNISPNFNGIKIQ